MKKKITIIVPLFILAFTFFFKQCEGCKKSKVEEPRVHGTVKGTDLPPSAVRVSSSMTFSMGFPAPIFDLGVVSEGTGSYRYVPASPYIPVLSVTINLAIAAGAIFLLMRLSEGNRWTEIRKLMIIICVNLCLFNLSVFILHMPQFLSTFLVYVYLYPVGWIRQGIELLVKLDSFNIPSRIYFVLLTALVYGVVRAVPAALALLKARRKGELARAG